MCKSSGKSGSSSGNSQNQPKQGGKSGQSKPGGGQSPSPLDRQGTATTERESAPQAPETADGGKQPGGKKPGEQQGGGEQGQSKQRNGDPRGNQATDGEGQNTAGSLPPKQATEVTGVQPSTQDRWGDLPEHARDVFRMQGGGDMPPRYREWIDAYYKRLNKKP